MSILAFQMPDKVVVEKATDFHGVFEFKPLEKGYGVKIGNALRRILLSSLEGYAITSVKFPGVLHEFSSVEGVVEDVTEIILNLKMVRFKKISDMIDGKITVNIKKQSVLTAGDIAKFTASFSVLNPDLVICHLDDTRDLEMEIQVERGRGYIPADEPRATELTFGHIPIDAVYTPVKRVNYFVEPTRVGQQTELDRLVIEIHTNGAMAPAQALSQAAAIFTGYLQLFRIEGEVETLPLEEAGAPAARARDVKVDDLDFSNRTYNCLKRQGIETLEELRNYSEEELMNIRNFGQKSLDEVVEKLTEYNLELRPPAPEPEELAI